jgi:hypothetical protein
MAPVLSVHSVLHGAGHQRLPDGTFAAASSTPEQGTQQSKVHWAMLSSRVLWPEQLRACAGSRPCSSRCFKPSEPTHCCATLNRGKQVLDRHPYSQA